ncbi:MAG: preprotein translocase subunit SecA [Dehalococcoidales bacterium]|nr:preprotein translocase subunit SecA [Dehalococcoidales bacterium]
MLKWLGGLIDSNEKEVKKLQPIIEKINSLEPEFEKLTDTELRAKTDEFKGLLAEAAGNIQRQVTEAQSKLNEAKQCLAEPAPDFDRDASSAQCKLLQDRLDELDKERRKVEKSALDELLPEAFAAVREAARRNIGQRHYDVQLMGGIALHQGRIAEMRTGEGKTLVATLPLYLNSLTGRGCQLATVNDYLARRDPYWMGPIYHALGISVASIYPQQAADEYAPARLYDPGYDSVKENDAWRHFRPVSRKVAYDAGITYGTSSEFGFDYLRDNMVLDLSQCVQRQLNFAIVDEVDNLLIDEARTPLIISGPDLEATQLYAVFARLVQRLQRDADYAVKEKERTVDLNDEGYANVEKMLKRDGVLKTDSLYDSGSVNLMRHLKNALSAKEIYQRDRDYVVQKGEVFIVDEFTGRLMIGRRYSEGLHQAIEAKEHVKVQQETKTYATITIQNYFRMYDKLGGMTGTAATEAEEFFKIYKLDVVAIPTNKPMVRQDFPDLVYKTQEGKFRAVANEIKTLNQQGRPVLVGTVSIENSERLSDLLKRQGIRHDILNAKQHEKEAGIIARAGEAGAVTVATNMAGRGVDIILGGKEPDKPSTADEAELKKWQQEVQEWQERHGKVIGLGGLHIIGTERHEARRIDNQLRGRAGRQGDPGSSRFYVSLEDDIMRRFGGERIKGFMDWAGMDEETPIENTLITRTITDVQKRVEGYHFDMRKHLVEYDDVVNKHREVIYSERRKILSGADLKSNILDMTEAELKGIIAERIHDEHGVDWDTAGLVKDVSAMFPLPPELNAEAFASMKPREMEDKLVELSENLYDQRESETGGESTRVLERLVMLRIIDTLWIEHLTMMEYMRQGIGLQSISEHDPLVAYKREGHRLFGNLMEGIQHDVAHTIYHVTIVKEKAPPPPPSPMVKAAINRGSPKQAEKVGGQKIGRNDPCPCGSGKKYKHCCGK